MSKVTESEFHEARKWLENHKGFRKQMEGFAFEMAAGKWAPGETLMDGQLQRMVEYYRREKYPDIPSAEALYEAWIRP